MSIVIAVDGTAASGKGTLAKRLAQHFGFAHLDSGALYRLSAFSVLEARGDPKSEADALRGAQTIDFNLAGDPRIRTDIVGQAASSPPSRRCAPPCSISRRTSSTIPPAAPAR